jgi:RND family efflux transporter MFP subunit
MRIIPINKVILFILFFLLRPSDIYAQTAIEKNQTLKTQKNINDTITLPAQVIAYQQATIYAKVAGYLMNITIDKGDKVRKNQLIADIEVPELMADREQFRAEAEVAGRIYDRLRIAMGKAPDLVVPTTVDDAYGRWKVAQAKLVRTEMLLSYAHLVAPFSGTVTARFVDPGAFIPLAINGKDNGGAVITLMDLDHIRIQAYVPAEYASRVMPGCPVEIELPNFVLHDKITRISYALDPTTQTMLAEVDRTNTNAMLHPNMYLMMKITLCANRKKMLAEEFMNYIPPLPYFLWG